MDTCEYEQLRRKNLEDNKRILAELGLSNPYRLLPKVIKKGLKRPADDETYQPKKKCAKVTTAADLENCGSIRGTRRLSARLRGQEPGTETIGEDDKLEEEHERNRTKYQYVMPDRPNWYGEVPGVDVGTIWMMRIDCCRDGIHRPTVAGIHGGPDGAYSIALSGGYEDDVDLGDCFTYTGEGGRDLKGTRNNPKNLRTAPQSKNQELMRGNLALSRSVETGNPVRVIRGYKLRSPFAPDEGYRYDGLYTVEKFWFTKGLSGFGVYKFALRRCKGQAPPPWELSNEAMSPSKSSDSGFSDTAACDGDSNDGQKSDAGDSDTMSDQLDKRDDADTENDSKSEDGMASIADNKNGSSYKESDNVSYANDRNAIDEMSNSDVGDKKLVAGGKAGLVNNNDGKTFVADTSNNGFEKEVTAEELNDAAKADNLSTEDEMNSTETDHKVDVDKETGVNSADVHNTADGTNNSDDCDNKMDEDETDHASSADHQSTTKEKTNMDGGNKKVDTDKW